MARAEFYEEIYKSESDAQGVKDALTDNDALDVRVRIRQDKKTGRWRVSVRSTLPDGVFDSFDGTYVFAFLTAWKMAVEGEA